MKEVVVDSGALLALWDPEDRQHRAAVEMLQGHLVGGSRLVVPVTALSEVLVGAFRATPYAVRTIEGFIDDLVADVRAVDRPIGRVAARLRAEHRSLPMAEALLIATGEVIGAQEILTADPRLAGVDGRVRVLGT